MPAATDPVELLERAIGYARGTLAPLGDAGPDAAVMDASTPCADWRLRDLLAHMSDGLDAFTEASRGHIDVGAVPMTATTVGQIRAKACALLGAWTSPAALSARLGTLVLESGLLLRVAALEVTVHGWDVGQATDIGTPLPPALADDLLLVAHAVVTEADRGVRFGPALSLAGATDPATRLLAHVGRTNPLSDVIRAGRAAPPSG